MLLIDFHLLEWRRAQVDFLKYLDDQFSLIKHYVVCYRRKLP